MGRLEQASASAPLAGGVIAVDLTRLLPGGENGGTKITALAVVEQVARLAPDTRFLLLTTAASHPELAYLERAAPNVQRLSVEGPPRVSPLVLADREQARLLFCPLTDTCAFFHPAVPTVAVVRDLQYLAYPESQGASVRAYYAQAFWHTTHVAQRVICISDFVRRELLAHSVLQPEQVTRIYHPFNRHRLEPEPGCEEGDEDDDEGRGVVATLGLLGRPFVLYPANFWPHKNHALLLTAFQLFRQRHPSSPLTLVLTGTPSSRQEVLQRAAEEMGLDEWVRWPGFVSNAQLGGLMQAAWAVVFPSLYEGFGMPLLEAMQFGKPLVCSDCASCPEIAGDAALYVDPHQPAAWADALEQLQAHPPLGAELVERGRKRLGAFGSPAEVARQYLEVFAEAVEQPLRQTDGLHGVYPDGWAAENLFVTYAAAASQGEARWLRLDLALPAWSPLDHVRLQVRQVPAVLPADGDDREREREEHVLLRGETLQLRRRLPPQPGWLAVQCDPAFQPALYGSAADQRVLGPRCEACQVQVQEGEGEGELRVRDLLAASTPPGERERAAAARRGDAERALRQEHEQERDRDREREREGAASCRDRALAGLQAVADERLALLQRLDEELRRAQAQLEEKEREIQRLSAAAEERLALLQQGGAGAGAGTGLGLPAELPPEEAAG